MVQTLHRPLFHFFSNISLVFLLCVLCSSLSTHFRITLARQAFSRTTPCPLIPSYSSTKYNSLGNNCVLLQTRSWDRGSLKAGLLMGSLGHPPLELSHLTFLGCCYPSSHTPIITAIILLHPEANPVISLKSLWLCSQKDLIFNQIPKVTLR